MIPGVNSTFSLDQSVLSFRSSTQLLPGCSTADISPILRCHLLSSAIQIVLLGIKGGMRNVSVSKERRPVDKATSKDVDL